MAKNTVTITGMDNLLLKIEGTFAKSFDEKVLKIKSSFIQQMDKAASRVFEAMGKDIQVGTVVARKVIGSHASTPSFLAKEGAHWDKLNGSYLANKWAAKKVDKKKNTHFWELTGAMKKTFRTQSERMARISNNTQRYEAVGAYSSGYVAVDKTRKSDIIFKPIRTAEFTARATSKNSKNYDITYPEGKTVPIISYTPQSNKSGLVKDQYIAQIKRSININVFRGYAEYLNQSALGNTAALTPENYLYHLPSGKEGKLLGQKLWYRKPNGGIGQRQLIQPYMRYYYRRIMIPYAQKLLSPKGGNIK